jgi:hypothetical protein
MRTAYKRKPILLAFLLLGSTLSADAQDPAYWKWSPTPPMGWNSYDAFGDSVTEAEVLANANYMRAHLLSHGWNTVVIDFRWYDSVTTYNDRDLTKERTGAALTADGFGRLLPAPNRFPSSADSHSFKPLADKLHAMGLKLGLHMMRGIPRQAFAAKSPIAGSPFTAADAGNPKDTCGWCPDMFGVRDNPAGQAWYDSVMQLCASWGIDLVKIDDLSVPYHAAEIAMIRRAIDKSGRAILFSTSPGPTDPRHADHVKNLATMWRISGDFWDEWKKLDAQFDLLHHWEGAGGPGHFPDADMIPFGHLSIRCWTNSKEHQTRFTPDEQRTLLSLWSLASSPLILGNNLPDTDLFMLSLLTNDAVLAIDQDALATPAARISQSAGTEIWLKPLHDGTHAIGLFNRTNASASITLTLADAHLTSPQTLPAHAVLLLHAQPRP